MRRLLNALLAALMVWAVVRVLRAAQPRRPRRPFAVQPPRRRWKESDILEGDFTEIESSSPDKMGRSL